jgi:hypothetical protein
MRLVLGGDSLATNRLNQGTVEIKLLSVKEVGRRTLIAQSWFLSQGSPFGISSGQSGVGTNFFSKYFGFPLAVSFHQCHLPEGQKIEKWKPSKNQHSLGNWGMLFDRSHSDVLYSN